MKKITFLATIILLTLSSCKKEVAAPAENPTLVKNQPQAIAGTTSSDNAAVPFRGSFEENLDGIQFYDSCTNEVITLSGSDHVVFHGVYDGAESKITYNVTVPGTVSAVGESGREYLVTMSLLGQEGEFSVNEFTFKFMFRYRFITKGGHNNFFYELTHYLKVDAKGNWTVIRAEVQKTYCR